MVDLPPAQYGRLEQVCNICKFEVCEKLVKIGKFGILSNFAPQRFASCGTLGDAGDLDAAKLEARHGALDEDAERLALLLLRSDRPAG